MPMPMMMLMPILMMMIMQNDNKGDVYNKKYLIDTVTYFFILIRLIRPILPLSKLQLRLLKNSRLLLLSLRLRLWSIRLLKL